MVLRPSQAQHRTLEQQTRLEALLAEVGNRMLDPLIRELVLELPEGRDLSFRAGSFMLLTAPRRHEFSRLATDPQVSRPGRSRAGRA